MRWLGLIALLAASAVGVVASGKLPWAAFQPILLTGSSSYNPTLRVSGLNFTSYDPNTEYAVFLCDSRAYPATLNAEMAVAHVDYRPREPTTCPFSIWDVATDKRVYFNGEVSYVVGQPNHLSPAPLAVNPSFYFADREERVRVQVLTPPTVNIITITRVESTDGLGACTDITQFFSGSFSCRLPTIPADRFTDGASLRFAATSDNGETLVFNVQALRNEDVEVVSITVPGGGSTLFSGARITVGMNRPLVSLTRLPWAPVLIDRSSNMAVPEAVFRDVQWAADGMSLQATLVCYSCFPVLHSVAIGEVLNYAPPLMAAAVTADHATALLFQEPACTFTGSIYPPSVARGALASAAPAVFIPVNLTSAPGTGLRVNMGAKSVLHDATLLPSAQPGHAVLSVSLWTLDATPLDLGFNSLTISAATYGAIVSRCSISKAFEITEHGAGDTVIYGVSQRVYFFGPGSKSDTVIITGANLSGVTAVRARLDGGSSAIEPKCAVTSLQADKLTCTLDNAAATLEGPLSIVLLGDKGVVATVTHCHAVPLGTVAFSPASVAAHSVGPLTATRSVSLPAVFPLELTLSSSLGKAYGKAQWTEADDRVTTFTNAFVTEPSTVSLVVSERSQTDTSLRVAHVLPGMLTVTEGQQMITARCFPSVVQTGTIDALGSKPLKVRVDIDEFALIASELTQVQASAGGSVTQFVLQDDSLYVWLKLKPAAGVVGLRLLDNCERLLLDIPGALTIEENVPQPDGKEIFVVRSSYMALVSGDNAVLDLVLHCTHRTEAPLITTSQGYVTSVEYHIIDDESIQTLVSIIVLVGDSVTLTIANSGGAITSTFYLMRLPVFRHFWASDADFTIGQYCVPFSATFDFVSARQPFFLALRDNPAVSAAIVTVDETTSSIHGCFICDKCESGTYSVGIVPPFGNELISPPSAEIFQLKVKAPRRRSLALAAPEDDDGIRIKTEGVRGAGVSNAAVIGLASAAAVLVVAAAGYVLWRRAARSKSHSTPATDSSENDTPYAAI
jgi:hypothetical protein